MLRAVESVVIDAHAQRHVGAVGRRADDDLARSRSDMLGGGFLRSEQSGRFDHDLHAEVPPRELRGVALGENLEWLAIDKDGAAFGAHFLGQGAMNRIILQEMRERGSVGDVVDGDDLERVLMMQGSAVKHSADTSESVDTNSNRHRGDLLKLCSTPLRSVILLSIRP